MSGKGIRKLTISPNLMWSIYFSKWNDYCSNIGCDQEKIISHYLNNSSKTEEDISIEDVNYVFTELLRDYMSSGALVCINKDKLIADDYEIEVIKRSEGVYIYRLYYLPDDTLLGKYTTEGKFHAPFTNVALTTKGKFRLFKSPHMIIKELAGQVGHV